MATASARKARPSNPRKPHKTPKLALHTPTPSRPPLEVLANTPENVVYHQPLDPGLHIAPFRDGEGRLLIVLVGDERQLVALWPVAGIVREWSFALERGARSRDLPAGVAFEEGRYDEDFTVDNKAVGRLDSPALLGPNNARSAVHVCPWYGVVNTGNLMVAITDANGCAHAVEEIDDVDDTSMEWPLRYLAEIRAGETIGPEPQAPFDYFPEQRSRRTVRREAAQ